jgi:hypothetical protein
MATIKYNLKSGTNKIYCFISNGRTSNGGFLVRKATGKELRYAKNWNKVKQEVRVCSEEISAKVINSFIKKHHSKIIDKIEELENNNIEFNKKECIKIIDNIENSVQEIRYRHKFSITEHLENYIELMITGKKFFGDGQKFSKETIKGYKTLFKSLKEFEDNKGIIKPHLIDNKLYEDLVFYFRNESDIEYKDSYIGSIIKRLKAFINNYLIKDLNIRFDKYRPNEWKKPKNETLKTYLTLYELKILLNYDLSNHPKEYEKVRDSYCFVALTCGIRIGDYMQLQKHNISKELINGKEQHFLVYKQSKTGGYVKAPISKTALEIINKHNGFPKIKSKQGSNKILKKLGKLCGFDQFIVLEDKKGNIIEKKRKYELMTNHSARRSFCTNAYDLKTDLIQIMKISGHSSPEILLEYINKSLDEFAERMIDTNYHNTVENLNENIKMKAI